MTLYYPPTTNGLQKTLDVQLDEGETSSLTLNNVTGIQNKPGVVVINRIDTNGTEKAASLREWIKYTAVSGSTLTGLTRAVGGSTDQDHAVGSVVEFVPDVSVFQAILDILDGTASGADLDTPTLTTPVINVGSDAQGDVYYRNGSGTFTRLGAGTDGQVLRTQGAGANPTWSTITESLITLADNTTNDVSTTKHGLVPKAPNDTAKFLRGDATWQTPSSSGVQYTDTRFKVGTLSRDLTAAGGDVSYTGVGFTPKAIIFFTALSGGLDWGGWGFSDGTSHVSIDREADAKFYPNTSNFAFTIGSSAGNYQKAIVKTFDADGFTLTWTKASSPTGTGVVLYLAIR